MVLEVFVINNLKCMHYHVIKFHSPTFQEHIKLLDRRAQESIRVSKVLSRKSLCQYLFQYMDGFGHSPVDKKVSKLGSLSSENELALRSDSDHIAITEQILSLSSASILQSYFFFTDRLRYPDPLVKCLI